MNGRIVWMTGAALLLASCGLMPSKKEKPATQGMEAIPPHLRPGAAAQATAQVTGTPVKPGGNVGPSSDNLVFTDPDNPDAIIPELDSVLQNTKRSNWEESESKVRRMAMQDDKCILVWFTDSREAGGSPLCKSLYAELFSQPDFIEWAKDNVVRFQVDENIRAKNKDEQYAKQDYVEAMRKRYRILGNPVLLVMSPDGEVVGRYVGYQRGNRDFLWGQLKSGVIQGEKRYADWKKDMQKKGYRQWEDRQGRHVFAKLAAYRNGELILVEPDGRRSRTQEGKLSEADRLWISEQKKARGM